MNTIGILEVVRPVVDEIPLDLLDLGSGSEQIGLDRLGREWRVGSLQQQTKESTLAK